MDRIVFSVSLCLCGSFLKGDEADEDQRQTKKREEYEKELRILQVELCALLDWIRQKGLGVIVVLAGGDGAGKGGTSKAITDRVSPRVFRVVALPAPSDREKSQLYACSSLPESLPPGNEGPRPVRFVALVFLRVTPVMLRVLLGRGRAQPSTCTEPGDRHARTGNTPSLQCGGNDSGKELHRFLGHTGHVWSVACSPDGRYALYGGAD